MHCYNNNNNNNNNTTLNCLCTMYTESRSIEVKFNFINFNHLYRNDQATLDKCSTNPFNMLDIVWRFNSHTEQDLILTN